MKKENLSFKLFISGQGGKKHVNQGSAAGEWTPADDIM